MHHTRFKLIAGIATLLAVVSASLVGLTSVFARQNTTTSLLARSYTSANAGSLASAGIDHVGGATPATGAITPRSARPSVNRPIHLTPKVVAAHLQAGHLATVAPLSTASGTGNLGNILSNFDGVSSHDSEVTNFGAEFEPPDQGLCAGNGFVLEAVNSAFTIYHSDGSVVTGPFNVNVLFDEGLTKFTSDPRCHFDPTTDTWFAIILFISDNNKHARTDVAVNSSGDPTTPWTVYHLDATDDGSNGTPSHPGCPCFGDQPLLGIDANNIYISTNEFSILGPQFNGAQIYALSKSDLVHLPSKVHFVHFDNLSIGGSIAASVQPALTLGTADAEYFLSSLDPNGDFDDRLGVWALTNGAVVSKGGVPTLTSRVIISELYGVPPAAPQKGAPSKLDSGDDRMQQTAFVNGSIWGELDTAVSMFGKDPIRAAAAWFRVAVKVRNNALSSARLTGQGYVTDAHDFLLYPAIAVTQQGAAAMVLTATSRGIFPSAAYTVLSPGQPNFNAITIAAAGFGHYAVSSTRWGDYSWAVSDPSGQSFWLATEYIPPLSSQTTDGLQNWGTRVLQIGALTASG
jgi:hypothetical protein